MVMNDAVKRRQSWVETSEGTLTCLLYQCRPHQNANMERNRPARRRTRTVRLLLSYVRVGSQTPIQVDLVVFWSMNLYSNTASQPAYTRPPRDIS